MTYRVNDDGAEPFVIPGVVGGTHRIAGTTTVDGEPRARRVSLYDVTGRHIRTTRSQSDGSWQISNLGFRRCLVIARDDHRNPVFEPATADYVLPVPMVEE